MMSLLSKFPVNSPKRWQIITSTSVTLIGGLVLLGWLFNLPLLKSVLPNLPSMKVNTALGFVLIGVTLWLLRDEPLTLRRRRTAQIGAAVVFLISLLTLVEYLFGWNFGIDQLLFQDSLSAIGTAFPGRMAQASAVSFVLLALAFWRISADRDLAQAQFLALIVVVFALFSLVGYLFEAPALYGIFQFSAMSFPTAIALFLAAAGILSVRPHKGWVSVLSSENAGGIMARRLLPAVVIIPITVGWIRLKGQELGLYGTEFGLALFALSNIVLFALLVWWSARLLNRTDAERRQSAERVRKLNRTLNVLSDVNQAIVRIRHIPTLYEKICQIAVELGGFRLIWIGLIDPVSQKVMLAAHAGVASEYQASLKRIVVDDARMQMLVTSLNESTDHVVYNDLQHDSRLSSEQHADMVQLNYHSLALLPLKVSGELRGFLNLAVDEPNFFDADELRLLDEMAGDIAFAMEFAEQEEQRQKSEAAVLETESHYRRLLDNLLEGAEIIGFDWHYLYVNEASASHGRQPKEVLLRSTVTELYPGIEKTDLFAALRTCMQERISQHIETDFAFPDGTSTWFELSVQPVPEGIFILSLDISERKRGEADLRRYAERMEILHAIDSSLIRGNSIQSLIESTLLQIRQVIPCQRANVSLIDEKTNEVVLFGHVFDGHTALTLGSRIPIPPNVFEGYDARHLQGFDDLRLFQETRPITRQLVSEGLLSALSVLLMDQDRPIGSLSLFADTVSFFTAEHQEIAAEITNQLAIAVRQWHLTDEIARHTGELERNIVEIRQGQEALREANEQLEQRVLERTVEVNHAKEHVEAILNNSTDGILLADADLCIRQTNPAFDTLFLHVADGTSDCHLLDFIHPEDVGRLVELIQAVMADRTGKQIELLGLRSDGTTFDVGLSIGYFAQEQGREGFVCTVRDISERKRADEALRESEKKFRSLVQAAPVATVITNQFGMIILVNQQSENLFGYTSAELLDQPVEVLMPQAVRQRHIQHRAGYAAAPRVRRKDTSLELYARHKDGSEFPVEIELSYVETESGLLVITFIVDIAERKERERQLRFSASLQQSVSDAVISRDLQFRVQSWNPAAERIYGWRAEEVMGKDITEVLRTQFPPHETLEQVRRDLLEKGYWSGEVVQFHRDGRAIHILSSTVLFKDENGYPFGIVSVNHDITERKRVEQAVRESEARYRLLADAINDVVIRFTPSFEYLYVSPSSRTVLGYEPEELLGKSDFQRIHPDDTQAIQDLVTRLMESPGSAAITYRFLHKQGHYIWLESTGRAIVSEQSGEVVEFVFSLRDVTIRKQVEEAIRESEARYRMLADNISDLITTVDTFGNYLYVSPSSRSVLGYDPEELIGTSAFALIHPDDIPGLIAVQTALQDPNFPAAPTNYRSRHKDGHYVWFETSGQIIWSEDKSEMLGFITVSRDITERKRAAEALALSEQRFSLLVNSVPDYAIYMLNPQGNVESWNSGAENIKGYSSEEIIGQNFSRFYTLEAIAQGDPQTILRIAADKGHYAGEGWRVRKDGSRFWAEALITALRDSQNQLIGFSKVTRDLTERKRVEDALLEQRDFLQLVIDNVPGLIMVKDRKGRFQLVNNMIAEVYGLTPVDMIGRTDADINPNQDQVAFFTQKDQETLFSGEPIFIAEEMILERYYQTSKIPLRKVGGVYDRLLIVASDITERKNAEEVLRRAFQEEKELGELKSRFVSMASHEFRTPLATILAAAETLGAYRQRMTEPQIDHRVNIVRDQVEHLKNIIEDVLQLARIQAGRLDFTPVILDLDSLCRSVIDEFESRSDITHPLIYRCDTVLRETKLDKKLMRQIINNLVSNAIKYSPEAKEVFITLEQRDETLVLSVRDQGIGIPEADQKHLFEPFHRAANVGSISGTGLGLPITKEAVELHGGTIQVDSQLNLGTTVTVIIPISKTIGNDHDENPGH